MFAKAIPFPNISPEIFSIELFGFNLALRWYALGYIVGIIIGWRIAVWVVSRESFPFKKLNSDVIDDFVTYAILGIIIGGRLFGTLVYNWDYYSENPLEIIRPPYAGMSFHGGFLGVILAVIFVSIRHGVPLRPLADVVALSAPFGIFLVRIANFINGELWGRPTDLPWGVIFPIDQFARHPSQIYEAILEGLLLALVLWTLYFKGALKRPGTLAGVFFIGYGLARILVEFVREPDEQFVSMTNPVGYAVQFGDFGITMGQLLSLPMVFIGLFFILTAKTYDARKSS